MDFEIRGWYFGLHTVGVTWLRIRKRYCNRGNLQLGSHASLSFALNLRPAHYNKAFGNHAHRIQARIQQRGSKYLHAQWNITILMFHMINGYSNLVMKAHVNHERSMLQCCFVPGKKPLSLKMLKSYRICSKRMVVWLAYSQNDLVVKNQKKILRQR